MATVQITCAVSVIFSLRSRHSAQAANTIHANEQNKVEHL